MDILSKLEKVEIQVFDKFPPEDMEYCRQAEWDYQEAYHIYSEFAYLAGDTNASIGALADHIYAQPIDSHKDRIADCTERFISKVCGYFRDKYAVTVESPSWETVEHTAYGRRESKRYDAVPLQYILDSVHEQMGGMSFEEKAFDELKSDAREAVMTYGGNPKYAIKGVKLVVDGFYHSYKDSIFERYEATVDGKHRAFFRALSHYEYGAYDLSQKYSFLCGWKLDEKDGVYDRHMLSSAVISSVKVFKNGKLEVEFKDYRTAVNFMDTYFPGIPQKTAA